MKPEKPEEDKPSIHVQQGETVPPASCTHSPSPAETKRSEPATLIITAQPRVRGVGLYLEEEKETPSASPMWSSNPGPVLALDP